MQLSLGHRASTRPTGRRPAELEELADWAEVTLTGDRAELARSPGPATWAAVSTGSDECPGAAKCPRGEDCFAEDARHGRGRSRRDRGQHPPLRDQPRRRRRGPARARPGRLRRGPPAGGHRLGDLRGRADGRPLHRAGPRRRGDHRRPRRIRSRCSPWATGRRAWPWPRTSAPACVGAERRPPVGAGGRAHRGSPRRPRRSRKITSDAADVKTRKERALKAVTAPAGRHRRRPDLTPAVVAWVESRGRSPGSAWRRWTSPPCSTDLVWEHRTAVLTTATIPPGLADTVGLPPESVDELDAGSPFDFGSHGAPLLRRPPARPPPARLRGGAARGAPGPHHRRRRPDPGPVHQLPGHAGRGRGAAGRAATPRSWSRATCPSPPSPRPSPTTRRPRSSPRWASGRASTSPAGRSPWSPSTGCPSPAPTSPCSRPAASRPGPAPSPPSTCRGRPPCWPRASAA